MKKTGWRAAKARSEAARKAARTRWRNGPERRKLASALGISMWSLWVYTLPKGDPRRRPMPPDVQRKYERLVKRG